LTRHSLARIDYRGLQMHRLTQAILRDRLRPGPAATARAHAEALLAAPDLGDAGNPSSWPEWAVFIPHLLAADLAATSNSDLCWQASRACWYLRARGDARACHELASHLYQHWRERLGGDDSRTLAVAHTLAAALRVLGRYADARDLDENSLARERRLRGDDHPNTLHSANSLAFELRKLGEVQAARDLDQDTLERRRRVLGDDHPDTLASASDLANDMRKLEEADDIPRRP
jgi:hypothetical protein